MTRTYAISLMAGLALAVFVQAPRAASQRTLGTVTVQGSQNCDPSRQFISGMSCYAATLTGCPGYSDLQFEYGVLAPSGAPNGTIVFFAGDGGIVAADAPEEQSLLLSYVAPPANYQVVQIAWGPAAPGEDWEDTNFIGSPNILAAACRPASFLNWVRNGSTGSNGLWGGNGGMCAEGHSAGAGAIAYALAWYNAGAATAANGAGYLDKVVLDSGPVFSNIEQGCEVPNYQSTPICSGTNQYGCKGWNVQEPPFYSLEYTTGYKSEVNDWSGNFLPNSPACANNAQTTTYNSSWFAMSILYNGGSQQPSFNYTNTAMSAWLCEATIPGVQVDNAAAQGELFYEQFTSPSQAGQSLSVNAVTACPSTEGVLGGTVATTGYTGSAGIYGDMTTGTGRCQARH